MKRKIIFLNLTRFVILSILFVSCDSYEKKLNQSSEKFSKRQSEKLSKLNDSALLSLRATFGFKGKDFDAKLTGPIKNELLAKFYISNYTNTAIPLKSVIGGVETIISPTECAWIDKDAIISFARELMNNPDLDGIRLYNARYLDAASSVDPQMDSRFNGRQTIVFVATMKKNNGRYAYHEDYYKMPNDQTTSLYIYDYNSLCPPADTCTGATLGGH